MVRIEPGPRGEAHTRLLPLWLWLASPLLKELAILPTGTCNTMPWYSNSYCYSLPLLLSLLIAPLRVYVLAKRQQRTVETVCEF